METQALTATEVDLHRLDLRFRDARLIDPAAINHLTRSIEQSGQLIPCIAIADPNSTQLILVDGYRRHAALRRLSRDTLLLEVWHCDLAQALLTVLAQSRHRPFIALEEALLLEELVRRQGLSEREVARRSGRDVSWVSRRLDLVRALPERALVAIRQGTLSTWAATRVCAPLARANTAHATQLLDALVATPLSTRELQTWFQHYTTSPKLARERMVAQPRLFIQSLNAHTEQRRATQLRDGPDGQCEKDIQQLLALIKRVQQCLPRQQGETLPETLLAALNPLRGALETLQSDLNRNPFHNLTSAP
jgi:ParB family chromosome partitioning protein